MENIELPFFKHIDTKLGLKYLNNNRELYIKILNNFLNRYESLNVESLDDIEFKDTIHSMKGLSATLGMVSLSKLARVIHDSKSRETLPQFIRELECILAELKRELVNNRELTVLVIFNNIEYIDILVEKLDGDLDLIVTPNIECVIEAIADEDVSLALLDMDLGGEDVLKIYSILNENRVPVISVAKSYNNKIVKLLNIDSTACILKPIDIDLLKAHIETFR